jgi:hypothetical protein
MRKALLRSIVLFVSLSVVAAACSKPRKDTAARVAADSATTTSEIAPPTSEAPTTTVKGQGKTNVAANRTATQRNPLIDDAQARAIGAQIKPQSTQRRKPYYAGVGEDSIKMVWSYDEANCGVNVVNAVTAAGGALPTTSRYYRAAPTTQDRVNTETHEAVDLLFKYFNEHAWDGAEYLPHVRSLMGNDPKNPYYGRHLVPVNIDGGSFQCPEKTNSAARTIANDIKPFAVFTNFDGSAYNMAAGLHGAAPADRRPMHFGTLWLSDNDYGHCDANYTNCTGFAPFDWTQFATGTTIVNQYASYVCARLVGGKASRSPNATIKNRQRVFGFVHPNGSKTPEVKRLAEEFKAALNRDCGRNIITKEVEYSTDISAAQTDATNIIVQLQSAQVTTVLMLADPLFPLFQLGEARGQNFYPEWVWSSFGYTDSSTVQRLYDDEEVKGSFGISQLGVPGGFGYEGGDPFNAYHAYHQVAPDGKPCDPSSDEGMRHGSNAVEQFCKAPGAIVLWYYTMLPAIAAVIFAGPDLTPQHATAGLQQFPKTRYGGNGPTSDPRPALVGAGYNKFGFVVDATEWRWRTDFTSPDPEKKEQWVEYPDCQRHYLSWKPEALAPNWEKGGPNYNAWCGAANGYPRLK